MEPLRRRTYSNSNSNSTPNPSSVEAIDIMIDNKHHHAHHRRNSNNNSNSNSSSSTNMSMSMSNMNNNSSLNMNMNMNMNMNTSSLSINMTNLNTNINKQTLKKTITKNKNKNKKMTPSRKILLVVSLSFFFILFRRLTLNNCRKSLPAKPVIEFYLHGRGSGHWTGSWGLMEVLLQQGYDLRVYATKPMPKTTSQTDSDRILKQLSKLLQHQQQQHDNNGIKGDLPFVNYTLVDAIMPGMEYQPWKIISIFWFRLIRWGVRHQTRPLFIISDGDLCGAISAYIYNIPSLYITHGQMFAEKPTPPKALPSSLLSSWKHQATLNRRSSQWTTYAIGFTHVPTVLQEPNNKHKTPPIRPRIRNVVQTMSCQRWQRIQTYNDHNQLSPPFETSSTDNKTRNPLVATYFRDSNGHTIIKLLVQEGIDVVVFGSYPHLNEHEKKTFPGSIIPVTDTTYFVPFMGIADGIVASAGCILEAECVHAQIPMLALFQQSDTEHQLNVYLSQQLKYNDGRRLIYGMSFEDLATRVNSGITTGATRHTVIPTEVQLFLGDVRKSIVSGSFYQEVEIKQQQQPNIHLDNQPPPSPCTYYTNELIEGSQESSEAVLKLLEIVKRKATC